MASLFRPGLCSPSAKEIKSVKNPFSCPDGSLNSGEKNLPYRVISHIKTKYYRFNNSSSSRHLALSGPCDVARRESFGSCGLQGGAFMYLSSSGSSHRCLIGLPPGDFEAKPLDLCCVLEMLETAPSGKCCCYKEGFLGR